MRLTMLFSLLMLAANVNWAQDDMPITIRDDGGTGGTGEGSKAKDALPASQIVYQNPAGTGDLKFGAGGFYVADTLYRAVCIEMPAVAGKSRVPSVDLKKNGNENIDMWKLDLDNGAKISSGYGGTTVNRVISITLPNPVIVDAGTGTISDQTYHLRNATLVRTDHKNNEYTTTFTSADGLTLKIHFCSGLGNCPAKTCD
jgi:hypothetical protein